MLSYDSKTTQIRGQYDWRAGKKIGREGEWGGDIFTALLSQLVIVHLQLLSRQFRAEQIGRPDQTSQMHFFYMPSMGVQAGNHA